MATGNYEEKEFIVFEEKDPTSDENRWQAGIDEWLSTQSDQLYHPPKEFSTKDENSVIVNIKDPKDKTRIDSNQVEIKAEASAFKKINKIEVYIDGSYKESVEGSVLVRTVNIENGIRKIKVRAIDEEGRSGESEITIGVNTTVEPTPTPLSTATPVVSPT